MLISSRARGTAAALHLATLLATACSDTATEVDATFATPSGLAIAGTDAKRLFVSNFSEDALQVLDLTDSLDNLDFVSGPAKYFPLRIPAGTGPTDLAATPDGRYILVLNPVTEVIRLIDADALAPVLRSDGEGAMSVDLGPFGTRPTSLVASPIACEAPCIGRAYVSLSGSGAVAEVEVHEGGTLVPSAYYDVGGEPGRLAIHPSGQLLFVTDTSAEEVVRIDLETGTNERRQIGGVGGPIAVSRDGEIVIVGRPAYQDLVILDAADGAGMVELDTNALFGPLPACQQCCADTDAAVCGALGYDSEASCADAHPGDATICIGSDGLQSVPGEPYRAVFVGSTPAQIVTLGESSGHPPLEVACTRPATTEEKEALKVDLVTESRSYTEFAVVVSLAGTATFVALRGGAGETPEPALVTSRWCQTPSATSVDDGDSSTIEEPAGRVLTNCPATPAERSRIQCQSDESGSFGVSYLPGWSNPEPSLLAAANTTSSSWNLQQWTLRWEAVLPTFSSFQHAGVINEDGSFTDIATDFGFFAIRPRTMIEGSAFEPTDCDAPADEIAFAGDIVQITTEPIDRDGCGAAIGQQTNEDNCLFERRIVGMTEDEDGVTSLQVCPPLVERDPSNPAVILRDYRTCFDDGGAIDFVLRVGNQFIATPLSGQTVRVGPGERIGPGGNREHSLGVSFGVRAGEARAADAACDRYGTDGYIALEAPAACTEDSECGGLERCGDDDLCRSVLARPQSGEDRRVIFTIGEGFGRLRSAFEIDSQGVAIGPAGRLPSAAIVSPAGVGGPEATVFVSYAASNRVLGFVPFDNGGDATNTEVYRLLR